MNFRSKIAAWIGLAALIAAFTQCRQIPASPGPATERISVGPGPEDMVSDTLKGEIRLLVSCSSRRDSQESYGEVVAYYPGTGVMRSMIRMEEPPGIVFRPHGIYLDGERLYVISHEEEPHDHPVLIYEVHGDALLFQEMIRSPMLHSPNALVTGPQKEIYVVNDSGKRGSILEKALRLKRANVIRLDKAPGGTWSAREVAGNLGYPAGINRIGNRLYVGDAVLHRIHVYTISEQGLEPFSEIRDVKGVDNLRIHNGQLLAPGHVKPFKFIGHVNNPEKHSPVEVFLIDPQTGGCTTLYANDGSIISAASSAIILGGSLYICQVFEPYLLRVTL